MFSNFFRKFRRVIRRHCMTIAGWIIAFQIIVTGLDFVVSMFIVDEIITMINTFILGRIIWIVKVTDPEPHIYDNDFY